MNQFGKLMAGRITARREDSHKKAQNSQNVALRCARQKKFTKKVLPRMHE